LKATAAAKDNEKMEGGLDTNKEEEEETAAADFHAPTYARILPGAGTGAPWIASWVVKDFSSPAWVVGPRPWPGHH
jgi:hypothetical protein